MDSALLLFAFMAGAAAFFAPCCVAILPAYIGYAVRPSESPRSASDTTTRDPRFGHKVATLGLLPMAGGLVPLVLRGLSTMNPLPLGFDAFLPRLDASVLLVMTGVLLVTLGLLLAGKGPAAWRGLVFGGLATSGFFLTFLAVGLPIAFLARGLAPYLTLLSLAMGLALILMGVLMVFGKAINPRLPTFEADVSGPKGFFSFGLAYGVAGLSCTFPVFLAVIGAGLASGGFSSALGTFAAYAAGKAVVLVGVTIVTVAGGSGLGARLKRHAPAIARTSAYLMILAGAYMLYYFGRFALLAY